MKDREILEKAIKTYGPASQIIKLFEELSELQKELCKNVFGSNNDVNIAEEIADVLIMIDQMIILYSCENEVDKQRKNKIERLETNIINREENK